jgi:hypothetical protein
VGPATVANWSIVHWPAVVKILPNSTLYRTLLLCSEDCHPQGPKDFVGLQITSLLEKETMLAEPYVSMGNDVSKNHTIAAGYASN